MVGDPRSWHSLSAALWPTRSRRAARHPPSPATEDMRLWSFGDCDRRFPYVDTDCAPGMRPDRGFARRRRTQGRCASAKSATSRITRRSSVARRPIRPNKEKAARDGRRHQCAGGRASRGVARDDASGQGHHHGGRRRSSARPRGPRHRKPRRRNRRCNERRLHRRRRESRRGRDGRHGRCFSRIGVGLGVKPDAPQAGRVGRRVSSVVRPRERSVSRASRGVP